MLAVWQIASHELNCGMVAAQKAISTKRTNTHTHTHLNSSVLPSIAPARAFIIICFCAFVLTSHSGSVHVSRFKHIQQRHSLVHLVANHRGNRAWTLNKNNSIKSIDLAKHLYVHIVNHNCVHYSIQLPDSLPFISTTLIYIWQVCHPFEDKNMFTFQINWLRVIVIGMVYYVFF